MVVVANDEAVGEHDEWFEFFGVDFNLALRVPAVELEGGFEVVVFPGAVPVALVPALLLLVDVQFLGFVVVLAALVRLDFADFGSARKVVLFDLVPLHLRLLGVRAGFASLAPLLPDLALALALGLEFDLADLRVVVVDLAEARDLPLELHLGLVHLAVLAPEVPVVL